MEKRLKLVGWQRFAGMVVGTLDMALWDARARAMDVSLAALLGGEIRPLPAYDSFGTLDPRTDLRWLEASVASGFKAIKIKEAAALPLSNHTFVEPSAHVMAVSPTASWFEYLDIAGAVLTEPLLPVSGMVSARGLGLDWDEHVVSR